LTSRTAGSALVLLAAALQASCSSCRTRALEVPEATYRETLVAFHTGLAAMQTSQEVLARREFEKVTSLVPGEPAGWANLGLLLMRQQELDAAAPHLTKAAELAPRSAEVQRLQALLESRQGRLDEAVRHWRRAAGLDPEDPKAPYALALDLERRGGDDALAEAQRALEGSLARRENLAARLELARLAAKRGDAEGLRKAVAPLKDAARAWPAPAQERWQALESSLGDTNAAATNVSFLKNVLLREPAYRHAQAEVTTPRAEVGEPLTRFLALRNPDPKPAPADTALAFSVQPAATGVAAGLAAPPAGAGAVLAMWNGRDAAKPDVVTAAGAEVRLSEGATLPFPGTAGSLGVVAADFNYDYRTDLILAGEKGLALFRQGEDGGFTDVTKDTKLPPAVRTTPAFGAWAADVDTDGDLDAVVAPVAGAPLVLRNNGDGTFAEQRPFAGIASLRGFVWADLEGDGVPDATLLDGDGGVRVFLNLRGGVLREATGLPLLPRTGAITAVAGRASPFDVACLGLDGIVTRLGLGADRRRWETSLLARPSKAPDGIAIGSARLLSADLDNNAAADLVLAGSAGSVALLAGASGAFDVPSIELGAGRAQAVADLDGDGRLDVLGLGETGDPIEARSTGSKRYGWQTVRPLSAAATGDQRINSFGIGGEVELRTGLHLQRIRIDAPSVHFGLGEAKQAEVVRITWPNGILQSEFNTASGATVNATQRLKGSCPWLFAWNGREMGFVTDLIWRSPLGLRINAQTTADVLMTEDWVKVRGDQLQPRDGAYDLRLTAELWETHFFDLVSLLVVDHPPDTEVFVDERFAVPPPALRVILTGPVREMAAARDDSGRDVSGIVRARDDRHLDFAGRGAFQGITRDHHVELELPEDAPREGPLYLLAQGWVHPTDSSVNVAIGQGKHAPPRGLSLQVADASGRFKKVRDDLGFPSGKDKTVVLDLAGLLPAGGPRRLRLATNLEVFWDRIGWAVGRPDVTVEPQRVEASAAELLYRGFNVTAQAGPSSPERPRYQLEGTAQRWLDLEGYHTRFGDVRELLAAVDDRYVIMNAGDEIRLRFPEAPAPGPGLVRDFVLIGDGWVKDGDFNTTSSRTVLPLPTHATGRYDAAPGDLEDDPVYQQHPRDFAEYHTRYVSPERVRSALDR
jgi:Flp pilus assembly protein TadD